MDILGNQVHPMVQILFPSNDTKFLGDRSPIHTGGSVQSWFEEREDALQHLPWLARLKYHPTTVVMVRIRFPLPSLLNQLEDVLH
jgi:hypothetical protein